MFSQHGTPNARQSSRWNVAHGWINSCGAAATLRRNHGHSGSSLDSVDSTARLSNRSSRYYTTRCRRGHSSCVRLSLLLLVGTDCATMLHNDEYDGILCYLPEMCCHCHHAFAREPVQLGSEPEMVLVLTSLKNLQLALMPRSIHYLYRALDLAGEATSVMLEYENSVQTLLTVSPICYTLGAMPGWCCFNFLRVTHPVLHISSGSTGHAGTGTGTGASTGDMGRHSINIAGAPANWSLFLGCYGKA